MSDEVGGDGVHADDGERKGPGAAVPDVGQEVKSGQKQETPTAAEQDPTRGPNLFNDGADTRHTAEPAGGQSDDTRDGEPADFGKRVVLVLFLQRPGRNRGR